MRKTLFFLLWTGLTANLLLGCRQQRNYDDSYSVQLASQAQDSVIRTNPQLAEQMIAEAKAKAQDSTEYYFAQAVQASLLMTRIENDSSMRLVQSCKDFCARQKSLLPIHYTMLHICENNRACIYQYTYRAEEAAEAYKASIEYCQKSGDMIGLPRVYNNLGITYYTLGNLPMEAYCYRRALFLCDSLNLPDVEKCNCYFMLANCYLQIKNYKQAKEYLDKAYSQYDNMPLYSQYFLMNSYVNLYYYQQDYEQSWNYLMKIFDKVKAHQNELQDEFAVLKSNYADLSIKMGRNLDQAATYLKEAEDFFRKTNNYTSIYYATTLHLALTLQKNDMAAASALVAQTRNEDEKNVPVNYLQNRNSALIEYYKRRHDYAQAFSLLEHKTAVDDSIRSEEHRNYIADQDMRYRNDTTHLKNRLTISQQQNKIDNLRLEATLGVVVIIALIVCFIEYRRRVRKERQQEFEQHIHDISRLKMQNIREKISPHFIFNVLNREINSHPEEAEEHQRLIQLTKLLRKGLDLSSQIAVPLSEELDFVDTYISLLQETGNKFRFIRKQDEDIETEKIQIPSMILQIPIENAVKHGLAGMNQEGVIELTIRKQGNGIGIQIRNNGQSYSPFRQENKPNGTGTGLKVIYQSILLMNTRNRDHISFDIRGEENGTLVSIYIPCKYTYDW